MGGSTGFRLAVLTVPLGFNTARSEAAGSEVVDLEVVGKGLEADCDGADCDTAGLELVGLRLGRAASEMAGMEDLEVVCLGLVGCEVTLIMLCEDVVCDIGRKSIAAMLCTKIFANK